MTQEPRITLVAEDKRSFLDLLLLADEQEDMIDHYLDRGDLFVMAVGDSPVAVCVVTDEDDGLFEIQNLAVRTDHQRHGYGTQMLAYVADYYRDKSRTLIVGTGDSPITVPFYEHCGFALSRRGPRGIVDAYDHPIVENGIQLIDKVYLTKDMSPSGRTIQSS